MPSLRSDLQAWEKPGISLDQLTKRVLTSYNVSRHAFQSSHRMLDRTTNFRLRPA